MTEQEYINVQNLTAVRIIRTALTLTNADSETEQHFKKIYDAVSDLTVILNGRVNILEPTAHSKSKPDILVTEEIVEDATKGEGSEL